MKIISVLYEKGKIIHMVTESEGKNSVEFFPIGSCVIHGKEIGAQLGKVEYNHREDTLTIKWYLDRNVK